ncbi:MAG: hypothetical protein IJA03_02430 [Bacteroidaceae bacterium]|nr:hypothetical protein [Bacteroidaceae bacterium]
MKFFQNISLLICLTCSLMACTDEHHSTSVAAEEAVLQLCFEDTDSRTVLNSSAPLQEVTEAYLYIFQGDTDGAPMVACEDLYWGKGMVQKEYKIRYNLDKGGQAYTVMAVGLDDASQTAYQWPATPETTDYTGITLGTAKAVSKSSVSMSQSEFFVGTAVVKYQDGEFIQQDDNVVQQNHTPTIEMKRRVAGILLYVTDIPCTLSDTKVTRMTLEMGIEQRKDLVLRRKYQTKGDKPADDVLDETGDSFDSGTTVLMDIVLPSSGYSVNGIYKMDAPPATDKVQYLENTILRGVYLLPVENSSLNICLYAEDNNTPLKTFPVKLNDTEFVFDIQSNHIYSIGQKLTPDNTLDDVPVSLLGDKVVLDAQDWTSEIQSVVFPMPDILFGIKSVDFDADKYIFNCMATDAGKVRVFLPEDASWILSVPDDCDWLYIREANTENTWEKSVNGTSKQVDIQLFMKDYAVVPDYVKNGTATKEDYENDYRTAVLKLNVGAKEYELPIRQYNAIVTSLYDEKDEHTQYVGFSRLDYGDWFNADGSLYNAESKHLWGYSDKYNSGIFVAYNAERGTYNGINNTIELYKQWQSEEKWNESAVGRCFRGFLEPVNNVVTTKFPAESLENLDSDEVNADLIRDCWYLSSIYELDKLYLLTENLGITFNLKLGDYYYWTSSPDGVVKDIYRMYMKNVSNRVGVLRRDNDDRKFYLRQATFLGYE